VGVNNISKNCVFLKTTIFLKKKSADSGPKKQERVQEHIKSKQVAAISGSF
jgi:hypothetical protein